MDSFHNIVIPACHSQDQLGLEEAQSAHGLREGGEAGDSLGTAYFVPSSHRTDTAGLLSSMSGLQRQNAMLTWMAAAIMPQLRAMHLRAVQRLWKHCDICPHAHGLAGRP